MPTSKLRLLIIDDSEIDNDYFKLLIELESINIDYVIQTNGLLGLEYLATLSKDQFPQFILVDINMPLMNGFECVREYEKLFHPKHPNTQVFMMSSTRRLSEIEEARKSNIVVDFIEKPLTKEHFDQFFFQRNV